MNRLKRNVLQCFKKLHRTRLKVFEGDEKALTAEARITEDTVKIVNLPFNDSVILEKGTGTPCCKDVKK
ncbi:hypothetical protein MSG28_005884 [Choristoneura fumiferana]|uniref:Uncharacterized protein n=1 Tax=Choristoneura fumiferana TaxID=7141 RepID=A0ACC0L1E2_CHOFU|nr:hypothetical protein MSG28_005884 [Choristoneura fumiferana]